MQPISVQKALQPVINALLDVVERDIERERMGQKTEETGQTAPGHFSRAPAEPSADVPNVPRDTLGRDTGHISGTGTALHSVPVRPHPTGQTRQIEARKQFRNDPRFAAWEAAMPAEEHP